MLRGVRIWRFAGGEGERRGRWEPLKDCANEFCCAFRYVNLVCCRMQEDRKMLEENVVRPFLGLGDAVLFDCRVLHFGTENRGEVRPVIYTNYWREFYRDPKNWDERESLFERGEGEGEGSGES